MKKTTRFISVILSVATVFSSLTFYTGVNAAHLISSDPTIVSEEENTYSEPLLNNPELSSVHIVTDENGKTTHYEDENGNIIVMDDVPSNIVKAINYPSKYDAREEGLVTSVKNQGIYGTCWAFASIANMETFLLKNKMANADTLDLSENHLVWFTKFGKTKDQADRTYGDGSDATSLYAAFNEGATWYEDVCALSRGSGPVGEEISAYGNSIEDQYRYNRDYSLDDYIYREFPTEAEIKEGIMKYGSVTATYFDTDEGYKLGTFYDETNDGSNSNHAVCIVGWDDDYPASRFVTRPLKNGAWLVKNSWGTDTSILLNGYFWMSYCEKSLIYAGNYTLMDAVDNIYQYECTGPEVGNYYSTGSIKGANIFTADKDEYLNGVGFYSFQKGISYRVRIILLNNMSDTIENGTVVCEQSGTLDSEGFHTINLSNPVGVSTGQVFAAEILLDTHNSDKPAYLFSESSTNHITPNVSFISAGDMYSLSSFSDGNLCIKVDAVSSSESGFASGTGTAEDPYIIETAEELAYLANSVNNGASYYGKCFKLVNDIVLNDTSDWENWDTTAPANTWIVIGTSSNCFDGTFDGDGHTVSGIYLNSQNKYQGLFGHNGSGAAVKNLGVEKSYIKGDRNVGGIVGYNEGSVSGCYNSGTVSGISYVGGIVGYNASITGTASVTSCYNIGDVSGTTNYVGGVVGYNYLYSETLSVADCYNMGDVSGAEHVGGIVGQNESITGTASVTDCYNIGDVSGTEYVGGIVGRIKSFSDTVSVVTNCYNIGDVSGTSYYVGGIVGYNTNGTISYCYYLTGCAKNGKGTVQYGVGASEIGNTTADVSGKTTGLSSSQMKKKSSYTGWDFDNIWEVEEDVSYPTLRCFNLVSSVVSLSGKVTSYNPNNAVTVELRQSGEVKYSTTIGAAASEEAKVTQAFTLTDVAPGTYDLVVTKVGHLDYTVTNVVVEDEDIDLTASEKAYSDMKMIAGDIDGNGHVNSSDWSILWGDDNYLKATESAKNKLADIDGNGHVNSSDWSILWADANYLKGKENTTFAY